MQAKPLTSAPSTQPTLLSCVLRRQNLCLTPSLQPPNAHSWTGSCWARERQAGLPSGGGSYCASKSRKQPHPTPHWGCVPHKMASDPKASLPLRRELATPVSGPGFCLSRISGALLVAGSPSVLQMTGRQSGLEALSQAPPA